MKQPKYMPDENLDLGGEGVEENAIPAEEPEEGAEETKVKIGEVEYTPEQLTDALKDSKDYKELLPEFTKKSQALAAMIGNKPEQENLPSFLKEGWKPSSFKELGESIKEAVEWGEKRGQKITEEQITKTKEAKEQVSNFVADIKKSNKDFNDKDFFEYIERHKIKVKTVDDLKSVYSTYSEANIDGKAVERQVLANKAKRDADSVSTPSSEGGKLPYDPNELRARGLSIVDSAKEALSKLKV